ncbi:MAG: DUF2782 domain-containing protein [Burkholderiaceae bacterium]
MNVFTSRTSRWVVVATLVWAVGHGAAFAQGASKGLEPLPDIPPPPKMSNVPTPDDDEGPQVTIRQDGETKVEEFRTKGGKVYAIRVTPRIGKPYVLVDPDGKGTMIPAGEINGGVKAPQWTLFEF